VPHRAHDQQRGLVHFLVDLTHLLEGETVWPLNCTNTDVDKFDKFDKFSLRELSFELFSFPSRRTTSTVLTKKLEDSATRSCTRSRQNRGACAGSSSAHQTAASSTSYAIETESELRASRRLIPCGHP